MPRIVVLAIAVTLCVLSATPLRAQTPDPNSVYVTSISHVGSGCPQGSVGMSFASDRKSFTLIFDSFVAATGPAVPSTAAKRDCELTLLLNVPPTFQGGEIRFDYRGYSSLGVGVAASHKRKYSSSKTSATTAVVGNVSRDYLYSDPVAFTKVKSCDGTPCLVAKVKIDVKKNDSVNGQLTVDSIEGGVTVSN